MSSPRSTILLGPAGMRLSYDRARLLVEEGPDAGRELLLVDRPVVLGRGADCDLRLADPAISARHAALQPCAKGWKVRDLESRAGTWIDGVEVEAAPLRPGARLRLGGSELVLRTGPEEVATEPAPDGSLEGLRTGSTAMAALFGLVKKAGGFELPVLLTGESGTGKESLARAVHRASARRDGPYEIVDCTLLEREHLRSGFFGHVKGAFTGALAARRGAFERADRGTVFLDEVGELPLEIQSPLLRVLEEGEVRPLGADAPLRVRTRVVSATHRDLAAMVRAGTFRQDLYFRLSALTIAVPPLREREGDVALLARHFLPPGFALGPEALAALQAYPWPGNVRELRNAVLRAAGLCSGRRITVVDLLLPGPGAAPATPSRPAAAPPGPATGKLSDVEAKAILATLDACRGNRRRAAQQLGIARSTLYLKLRALGIA